VDFLQTITVYFTGDRLAGLDAKPDQRDIWGPDAAAASQLTQAQVSGRHFGKTVARQ